MQDIFKINGGMELVQILYNQSYLFGIKSAIDNISEAKQNKRKFIVHYSIFGPAIVELQIMLMAATILDLANISSYLKQQDVIKDLSSSLI